MQASPGSLSHPFIHLQSTGDMGFEIFAITVLIFGGLSGGIVYIIARAVTLALAFTSLRDLPPGAYETVHWTTFIPHV